MRMLFELYFCLSNNQKTRRPKMKSIIIVPLIFILLSTTVFAQSVDKVILVSDTTSVDMLIAKAAAEKTGMPILILENGTLSDSVKNELAALGVRTVILVGGPVVIKPETETALQDLGYIVVRLWGMERTGTSLEVAKYFWQEGAPCAVLADDTKDSDADTDIQAEASEAAANSNCPFIPVPKGKIPAEVLDIISELNISEAKFVGLSASAEFRSKLAKLRLKEIVGSKAKISGDVDAEIENRTKSDNGTLKLLVIAAPHWKNVLGHAGHSERHTIVRIVSGTDAVPKLVELINAKNITDVRVLGQPALAGDIASLLEAQNITVKKISGEKASAVAIDALKESIVRWEERRRQAVSNETLHREKIKQRLYALLNKTEDKLNRWEAELAQLNASGANEESTALLQNKIDDAQSQLSAIKTYIENGNYDTARIRLAKVMHDVAVIRWTYRTQLKLNINDDINDEEDDLGETERKADVSSVESRLPTLRANCNAAAIENLVNKSKSLRQAMEDAKASGDFPKASQFSIEVRDLAEQAKHLGDVCEKSKRIAEKFEQAAEKIAERAEGMRIREGRR